MVIEWQDSPTVTVETAVGPLRVTVGGPVSAYSDEPGARHASVRTHPFEVNAPGTQVIRIHGVDYCAVRIALTETPNGWTADGWQDIGGAKLPNWSADMSSAAVKWLRANVVPQISAFLVAHPELIVEADKASAAQGIRTLEPKIEEARKELDTLETRRAMLLGVWA